MILKPFAFELSNPNSNTVIPELARGNRTTVHEVADEFGYGSAEHVIAHAKRQSARGKAPSMHFDGISNPKLALASAEAKIANKNELANVVNEAQRVLADGQAELARTMSELDRVIFVDWTGGSNNMPRLGGYVIPSRLASQYVDLHQRAVAGPDHTVYNTIHDQGYPSIGFGSPEGTEGRWGSVITPAEVCGKFALESVRIA